MANTIKGLTVEIGGDTTKLGKALEDVNKKTRDLSGELGQINKLLKFDPGNGDLLAQKQKVLAEAVSNTSEKLEKLKEAEKQVQAQFQRGEVSEAQVRELQREIIETTKKLEGYEKAARETTEALDKLGRESDDAADEIKDAGKQAEKAEKSADELGDTLNDSTSVGFTAVATAAAAAVGAIVGCIESSEDYRREMGKLTTAFEDNDFSAETAKDAYKDLQKILGETDQTVEAVNHLAALVDTEEELAHWTGDILPGVYAKFGASLQPEALTEAANETAKTGQVTGALADALNWAAEEGETFGIVLKDNIEFTELSEDELSALTDAQRDEYKAREKQYEAIEEYNAAVGEAVSAEDYFNLALQNCTTEQERQQLITKTLTKMYGKAAAQYKKTNKTVIESNEATEEWNATVAELGEEMAPLMTDIKKFGTSLLQNAKEPLKAVASFISDKVLPALTNIGRWVSSNIPIITAALVGFTTAFVAYKVAVVAAEVAHKGLKGAILATEVAQKALNLAQAATPMGLVAVGVTAVVAGLAAYVAATRDTTKGVEVLTDAEKKLLAAAQETAEELRDQRAASDEAAGGSLSQMAHVTSLANELKTLASASGEVQEKDRARVEFILGELNEALGTEYTMTDGVIQKYDELSQSIDEVIAAKTANSLLEAYNAEYVASIQAEATLLDGLNAAQKDHQAQLEKVKTREQELADARSRLSQQQLEVAQGTRYGIDKELQAEVQGKEYLLFMEQEILKEKEQVYNDAATAYGENAMLIKNYDDAQTAALEGNYGVVKDLLVEKGQVFGDYAATVDDETAKALDALYKEAINAGIEAERMKQNFENGVDGYTQEMVDEAEKGYEDALNAYADARIDAEGIGEDFGSGLVSGLDKKNLSVVSKAEGVGKDLGDGLTAGMEAKRSNLISKAKSLVSGIISAMKKEADSNSPSKKTMAFGEDMGEGAEIGIENKTKDVARAAQRQVGAVLDAYREEEAEGQATIRKLTESRSVNQITNQMAAASANSEVLGKILDAIERGQILTIDGSKLVGATAGKIDNSLGQRRVLVTRGAL